METHCGTSVHFVYIWILINNTVLVKSERRPELLKRSYIAFNSQLDVKPVGGAGANGLPAWQLCARAGPGLEAPRVTLPALTPRVGSDSNYPIRAIMDSSIYFAWLAPPAQVRKNADVHAL
jgi:hypothetical protein